MSEVKTLDQDETYPYIKGIPLLLGIIKPKQDICRIEIANAEWFRKGLPMPRGNDLKIAEFIFKEVDGVLNLEGNFEFKGDLNNMTLGEAVKLLQQALNALWHSKLDCVRICNLPGFTLLDLVDSIPEDGMNVQWEQADLIKIILAAEALAQEPNDQGEKSV